MKINVDYNDLHEAIDKLKNGEEITTRDRNVLLELITSSEGDYYPTKEELKLQEYRVKKLDEIDFDKNRSLFDKIIEQCSEYENKYC